MSNRERESAAATLLARRAYLYSLLHVVFGGRPGTASAAAVFSAEAVRAFAFVREALCGDGYEGVAARTAGSCGRSLAACAEDALACVERGARDLGDPKRAEELVSGMRSDYDRLFHVPGERYVRPWESPYTGKESMVFQESTLDVRSFYHDAGFKLAAERRFPDDHVAALMDYLGRMGQRAFEAFADGRDEEALRMLATQRRFAERHVLNWVDRFAGKVIENDVHARYGAFAGGMVAFAFLDDAMVGRLERELDGRSAGSDREG